MSLELPPGIPGSVLPSVKIYKNDCMYCYDTAENNELGLDIDLKTYKAYSRNKDFNFTRQNYERTGNYLYLNIKKTLKPQEEVNKLLYDDKGEKNCKIQKLEVKNVKEDEYYVTSIGIYNVKEDKLYSREQISAEFQRLIDQILEANSSSKVEEIKQWEQEIEPCPHSIDLHPDIVEKVDLTKCSKCGLKENLWICLHCGALGCGRQQFGSSLEGNGHALAHYENNPTHPVALKLGSLSSNPDSCDAYCYQCNDEVKVPDLAIKLEKFGIDLSVATKTEKSLVELNIDQNMNWDFKLEGVAGEKLAPVYGRGFTGIQNLGNSCYMNSVLQALFDLEAYQEFFKNLTFDLEADPAQDLTTQLIKLYDGLYSGRYSVPGSLKGEDYQLGIKPSTFKTLVAKNHEEFQTQKQQDAFEFLQYFLGKGDQQFGMKLNRSLKFLFANKVICAHCKHGSITSELLDNISVPIEEKNAVNMEDSAYEKTNLERSLELLSEKETIDGYKCENCSVEPGQAFKSGGFATFPKNLIISVQRIKLVNWTPTKVDVPIEIPYSLDLSKFRAPKFDDDEIEKANVVKTQEETETRFEPNEGLLNVLQDMGFPQVRCINALYATGNQNAEEAMNWIFAHMEEPEIDKPLVSSGGQQSDDEEVLENLIAMGFSRALSEKALHLNGRDPNAAVEWLFANPNDDGVLPAHVKPVIDVKKEEKTLIEDLEREIDTNTDTDSLYRLKSVICHKGSSPHTGHYVVFVRRFIEGDWKWVLFNDEKVVVCDENNLAEIERNGYIYIFGKTTPPSSRAR
ncbi:hypothetical protein KGF56_002809 [Candida oxycetoniae]|uniref:Ubiquitin carboxyl-terminal hydrolase n=1 Tax=Candida oxycetoniae TaxID=497107 RepID=A0AAI9SWT4_9ASCO|nr:uncharacterized protein KGF56_002809 [Candida oxycetoniae]KAI3404412.2 hypothetical protein KGF56_002809 [Candida oxycetoniae]